MTHRYAGVVVGLLMLLWCLSGIVMLFVHYPDVRPDQRLAQLAPLQTTRCCTFGASIPSGTPIRSAAIEDLAGTPVLRLQRAGGERQVIDLTDGQPMRSVAADKAAALAVTFNGPPAQAVVSVTSIVRDQWTVSGEFNRGRPFWRVRLADSQASDIYVSSITGEVIQRTTRPARILNWLGAVPHWLYPTLLRQDVKLWSQVVIWASLLGAFLTLTGLYLGLVAWRPFRDGRLSPYRGLMTWHHLGGLATGLLTLSWVVSGLLSMNPWGFLESADDPTLQRVAGPPPPFSAVAASLAAVIAQHSAATRIRIAPLGGELYVLAGERRYDAQGRPAPLGAADLASAGSRLDPGSSQGMITTEDAYYFAHHDPVTLPAWRVIRADGTRVYLDPASGDILAVADPAAQQYRWLHKGLHRLDFIPGFNRGAGWSLAMTLLLLVTSLGVGSGVWLAWRRVASDLGQVRRRR